MTDWISLLGGSDIPALWPIKNLIIIVQECKRSKHWERFSQAILCRHCLHWNLLQKCWLLTWASRPQENNSKLQSTPLCNLNAEECTLSSNLKNEDLYETIFDESSSQLHFPVRAANFRCWPGVSFWTGGNVQSPAYTTLAQNALFSSLQRAFRHLVIIGSFKCRSTSTKNV